MNFKEQVLEIVRHIPKGHVLTYKEVATMAGKPSAARAVGQIMSKNFNEEIPCHRVVRTDGTIGNYNRGGADKKREILIKEGVFLMKNDN